MTKQKKMPIPGFMDCPMVCGSCGAMIGKNKKIKYCPFCGIPLKIYTDKEAYEKTKKEYGDMTF